MSVKTAFIIAVIMSFLMGVMVGILRAEDASDSNLWESTMKPSDVLTISTGDGKAIKITNDDILSMSKSELQDLVTLISFYSVTSMADGKVADVFVREFIPRRFIER